ncbi:hypothetical protein ACHAWF_003376 [Thalassiosira exigua]
MTDEIPLGSAAASVDRPRGSSGGRGARPPPAPSAKRTLRSSTSARRSPPPSRDDVRPGRKRRSPRLSSPSSRGVVAADLPFLLLWLAAMASSPASGGPVSPFRIVVDVGSTGSRLHVFELVATEGADGGGGAPRVECLRRGSSKAWTPLSAFAPTSSASEDTGVSGQRLKLNATHVAHHMLPLFDYASDVVPSRHRSATPVRIAATAGMRLLPARAQAAVYDALYEGLAEQQTGGRFAFDSLRREDVTTLDGEREGFYGAVAANYLRGVVDAELNILVPSDGGGGVEGASAGRKNLSGEARENGSSANDDGVSNDTGLCTNKFGMCEQGDEIQFVHCRLPRAPQDVLFAAYSWNQEIEPLLFKATVGRCESTYGERCYIARYSFVQLFCAKIKRHIPSLLYPPELNEDAENVVFGPSNHYVPQNAHDVKRHGPLGALDMGGSSTQIVYRHAGGTGGGVGDGESLERDVSPAAGSSVDSDVPTRLDDEEFFSTSYLSYGADQFRERLWDLWVTEADVENVGSDPPVVFNPCSFVGYRTSHRGRVLLGTGNAVLCAEQINRLIPHHDDVIDLDELYEENVESSLSKAMSKETGRQVTMSRKMVGGVEHPPIRGKFYGMSLYFFTLDCLRELSDPDHPIRVSWPTPSIEELTHALDAFCARAWHGDLEEVQHEAHEHTRAEVLPHRCVEAVYMVTLLRDGFGFHPSSRDITFTQWVEGNEVEWSLGMALSEFASERRESDGIS